jgi:glycerol-3-phosphate dehydrogenase
MVLKAGFRFAREVPAVLADEARLAVLNAVDARARGAQVRPQTRCLEARRENWFWRLTLEAVETGHRWQIVARGLVNAAGAQAGELLGTVITGTAKPEAMAVRSSYIVVQRALDRNRGYVLTGGDGRLVLALPLGPDLTLIGPSEAVHTGDPMVPTVTSTDIDYLAEAANFWFRNPLAGEDIAWTSAGVRTVKAGARRRSSLAGEIERDIPEDIAPVVSVFDAPTLGHRLAAEAVVDALKGHILVGPRWTRSVPLPGGHFPVDGVADLVRALRAAYPFVPVPDAERMVAAYGTRATTILSGARRAEDLGHRFGAGLSEAEVRYLMEEEWARTASDILWRRTNIGLRMSAADAATLDLWMARARQPVAAPAA